MKVVWIIDRDQWPRALLRGQLIELGFDAVGYLTAADALASLGVRFPDVIVIDLTEVGRSAVEDLFKVGVPVIGIAGIPEPSWRSDFKWVALLRRPVSLGEIADAVNFQR